MKFCPVGAELFHADGQMNGGQTEIMKLTVAFCNFVEMPKGLGSTEII